MFKKLLLQFSNWQLSHKKNVWELIAQGLVIAVTAVIMVYFFSNYLQNVQARNIGVGFDFLDDTAGYQIGFSLIEYSEENSYFKVYLVGLINTLLASMLAIIFATFLGFILGITLLANNWLLRKLATWFIELLRNIPPLLHVLFWYVVVILRVLPNYSETIQISNFFFFNVRGLTIPEFNWNSRTAVFLLLLLFLFSGIVFLSAYAKRRLRNGTPIAIWYWNCAIIALAVFLYFILSPFTIVLPEMGKFRFTSGFTLFPELFAIVVALATYTSTYIATIVRSSILSIPKVQIEAAQSLGLNYFQRLRYITLPLALRSMIPPLTNQYLNITKNSSLGVAIGYPEIVAVFAGTALNQSGRAIEIMSMVLITYLVISVTISILMNIYNQKVMHK